MVCRQTCYSESLRKGGGNVNVPGVAAAGYKVVKVETSIQYKFVDHVLDSLGIASIHGQRHIQYTFYHKFLSIICMKKGRHYYSVYMYISKRVTMWL